jgi:manganese containing catalase
MPGKYKDLIMDIATEEVGHVEMIATMVARLLEGALATATTKAAAADPVVGAVLDGMDPQQPSSPGGVAAQAAVGRGWSSLCCLHAHAVNASQLGGQLRAASVFRRNYCSILIFLLSSSGLGVTD